MSVDLGSSDDTVAREHYIPFTRQEIYQMLADDGGLGGEDAGRFTLFTEILQSLYHFEFHSSLEALKTAYGPFNPDRDPRPSDGPASDGAEPRLLRELTEALTRGNFLALGERELESALSAEGLLPVSLDVDFTQYAWFKVFVRGRKMGEATVKGTLPFTKRKLTFEVLDNVILVLRFREDLVPTARITGRPGGIYLKCLRGVPVQDLEMMFPDARPQMKLIHKLKVGVPAAVGIGMTLHKIVIAPFILRSAPSPFETGLSLPLVTLIAGLVGYAFKAWSGYKNVVQTFLNEITASLYFKNTVNNQGVFNTLVDTAEEEETKEAVLGYYFLLIGDGPSSARELDLRVEAWFKGRHATDVDFEVEDALAKLERFGLVTREGDRFRALPIADALTKLDERWDGLFRHA